MRSTRRRPSSCGVRRPPLPILPGRGPAGHWTRQGCRRILLKSWLLGGPPPWMCPVPSPELTCVGTASRGTTLMSHYGWPFTPYPNLPRGVPTVLPAWLFVVGLHPESMKLTNVAKATIYKYHLGLEEGNASHLIDLPILGRGYRVWIPEMKKVVESRDCVFKESDVSRNDSNREELPSVEHYSYGTQREIEDNPVSLLDQEDVTPTEEDSHNEDTVKPSPTRSHPMILRNQRNAQNSIELLSTEANKGDPTSYKEAIQGPEAEHWLDAIEEELESLRKHNVWELTELPKDSAPIACKWVLHKKTNAEGQVVRYKARLVAKGFTQQKGIDYDEIYSPVSSFETTRLLTAIGVENNWFIDQYDVKSAYLYGKLDRVIYMEQPEGFVKPGEEHLYCQLKRSLYGLKQSGRCWNKCLDEWLKKKGFVRNPVDPCVYKLKLNEGMIILSLYVDDILTLTENQEVREKCIELLRGHFETKYIGPVSYLLGVNFTRSKDGCVTLTQRAYIKSLLERFNLQEGREVSTPMETRPELLEEEDEENCQGLPYRELIGGLLYISQRTRPDIAYAMLQKAFKDDCISRSQSGKWHKAFKEGREEVADEPRSGRPTTARTDENVDRVLEVLRTDRRLSIQQIADTLHMSTFVVNRIVTEDLQMRKICAKLVPKVLTQDQKELRVLRCQELLDLIQNEPGFLNSVVTEDESWMFEYDPESKGQNCAWHTKSSPRPKKARMSKSRIKTMIIVFFDIRGIVHCEFVPQGQTVKSAFYLEVLKRLKRRIARVRTDIKDTVKLHHDNATSHTAFIITNFLARSNTPLIPDPPYSPDLAPCDFFLFPRLKREMKGKHWETVENIQHHVTTFLGSIPVEEYQVIVAVYACGVDVEKGPIRQQLWNAPPCDNVESWFGAQSRMIPGPGPNLIGREAFDQIGIGLEWMNYGDSVCQINEVMNGNGMAAAMNGNGKGMAAAMNGTANGMMSGANGMGAGYMNGGEDMYSEGDGLSVYGNPGVDFPFFASVPRDQLPMRTTGASWILCRSGGTHQGWRKHLGHVDQ
ncbi:hypothetical protein LAZ67_21001267 [Cordylochernes scorpioides]|uniref:Uncharacterized protein n=1 Tax=Cordylochernes scorpioides TaxID=51811 RepID=A0ABY6LM13_9ARAC|nr:hypothetical protein LAZ67_21001267 [Cordylochernes scorpioides]